ncbi:MAG: hypothetical protein OIF51_18360 [Cellvibrionaceae bacterium]|nr:hypothetical protein [Cellvibrionaceae bacterium]
MILLKQLADSFQAGCAEKSLHGFKKLLQGLAIAGFKLRAGYTKLQLIGGR